jgi:chromosome segregation ATPase
VIEEAMIFALGFLVAGLLTLAILPAVWRRALRLSARRLEMQMPLSMTEILAQQDQLRAQFAVKERGFEQRAEVAAEAIAATKSELGRRAARLSVLATSLQTAREKNAELSQQLLEADRVNHETRGEAVATSKALYDAHGLLDNLGARHRELDLAHRSLGQVAEDRRAMIATLEADLSARQLHIDDVERELAEARATLEQRARELRGLADERDLTKAELGTSQIKAENLRRQFDHANEQIAALDTKLQELVQIQAISSCEFAERADRADAALQAASVECDRLRAELAGGGQKVNGLAEDGDLTILRSAISDMATDVLRLAASIDGGPTSETRQTNIAGPLAFPAKKRQPQSAK